MKENRKSSSHSVNSVQSRHIEKTVSSDQELILDNTDEISDAQHPSAEYGLSGSYQKVVPYELTTVTEILGGGDIIDEGRDVTAAPHDSFASITRSSNSVRSRRLGRQQSHQKLFPVGSTTAQRNTPENTAVIENSADSSKRRIRSCWTETESQKRDMESSEENSSHSKNARPQIVPGEGELLADDQTSGDGQTSMCTVARGLLATSGFIWVPLCRSGGKSQTLSVAEIYLDSHYELAQQCIRQNIRRNALADPMLMAMKQETRERIEREVESRKSSVTRKVSQYFKAIISDDYEVDLI